MRTAINMFELHPPGTKIGFNDEQFTVCEDGLWRNQFGMVPAGQVNLPPQPAKHCRGCRCDEPRPRAMRHGGVL